MNKQFDKLYSERTDGKTQIWWMEQQDNKIRSHSGQFVDGKIVDTSVVVSEWKEIEATNVGRSNERNPTEQATFAIETHYRMRMENGAVRNIGDAPMFKDKIKPMLAEKFEDATKRGKKIKFPCFVQPKLDGMRCIATAKGLFSRSWKPIVSTPHIYESLLPYLEQGLVLDGELYNHELKHNFGKIMSLCKKTKPTDLDLEESRQFIQFWCFDLIQDDLTFTERQEILKTINADFFVLVPTEKIDESEFFNPDHPNAEKAIHDQNMANLNEKFEEMLFDGFEGQMIRYDMPYQNKRSKSLIKRKTFIDEEYTIVSIDTGSGNWANYAKVINCVDKDGKPFSATLKNNQEYCAQVLKEKDKYIGGEATVRYQELTDAEGVPRFGIAVALYEGKRDV